jgi:hypothetical protein
VVCFRNLVQGYIYHLEQKRKCVWANKNIRLQKFSLKPKLIQCIITFKIFLKNVFKHRFYFILFLASDCSTTHTPVRKRVPFFYILFLASDCSVTHTPVRKRVPFFYILPQ